MPPLFVGTAVLLGGGISAAWVDRTLPAPVAGGASRAAPPATTSAEVRALKQVRQTLAADKLLLSSLSSAARKALAASEKTTVVNQVGSGSGAGAASAPAAGGGSGSLGALPALPSLPPMPTINIPTTQGTTGATHVAV